MPAERCRAGTGPSAIARYARAVAVSVAVALVVASTAGHVVREAIFVAPDMEADQLNIATMALAQHEPGVFGRDITYRATADKARWYTPWQIELAWNLWKLTDSPRGAFGAQLPGMVLLSMALAGGTTYWLSRSVVSALIVAAVGTAYRPVIQLESWGVGPFHTAIPRAWGALFVFAVLALWVRSVERRSGWLRALAGLLCGISVNVHPPTGVPLSGAFVFASFLHQLGWRRRSREGWAWWIASCGALGVCAAPFLVQYASA